MPTPMMTHRHTVTLLAALASTGLMAAYPPAPPPAPAPEAPTSRTEIRRVLRMSGSGADTAASEPRPVVFLGVEPRPVDPALAAQLGLDEGVGLAVGAVLPDSPAAQAGLLRHDLLLRLDDQILVDARQLRVLLQRRSAGDTVTLTLIRRGQEQKVPVTLATRLERSGSRMPTWVQDGDVLHGMTMPIPPLPPLPPEGVDHEEILREVAEALRHSRAAAAAGAESGARAREAANRAQELARDVTILNLNRGTTVLRDGEHIVTLRRGEEGPQAEIRSAVGQVLFDGPVATEEQRAALPADLRAKLESLERNVRPGAPRPAPAPPPPPAEVRIVTGGGPV